MIKFTKMHGLGNDFMVIETFNQIVHITPEKIRQWSDRKTGIGFDQLLLLSVDLETDAHYQIYNADGKEVEHCGNGARCVAKFLWDTGLVQNRKMTCKTQTRTLNLNYQDDDHITVDMGQAQSALEPLFLEDLKVQGLVVDVGNPHFIIESQLDSEYLQTIAPKTQASSEFSEGVNVSLLYKASQNQIDILTYERGVGLTEACGTAACAAAFVFGKLHRLDQVQVNMKGGTVQVQLAQNDMLSMIGPARTVYQGEI